MVVVTTKHSAFAAVICILMVVAAAYIFMMDSEEDAKCPYCDIKALNEHGGTIEYDRGSGPESFVIEPGQYHVGYNSDGDCLVVEHNVYDPVSKHWRWELFTRIYGSEIIRVTVNQ